MGRSRPEYEAWKNMIRRCSDPRVRGWPNYGGRGIAVCAEWRQSFAAFLAHIGPRPTNQHSLDRIKNDGNYEPGNVRWATQAEQVCNRHHFRRGRSPARLIAYNGVTLSLTAWARRTGLPQPTLHERIVRQRWDVERALTTPLHGSRHRQLTFNGQCHSVAEWSRLSGIGADTLLKRLSLGWSVERTLTLPRQAHMARR